MKFSYPYTAAPQEGGGYFVQFLDFEEAFTEGATLEEAAFNAAEVLSGVLAHRRRAIFHAAARGARRPTVVRPCPRAGNLVGVRATSGRPTSLAQPETA